MAKIYVLTIFALTLFQGCFTKPADKSQLETLADNAKLLVQNVTNTLGLQEVTSEKVLKTINDQAKTLSDNLNTLKDRVQKEVGHHEGDVKKSLKDLEDKINKSLQDIGNVVDPDKKIKKGADEIRTQFDASFKTAAEGIEQWVKSIQPKAQEAGDNVQKFTKNILDLFLEAGKDIQTKVNKAIEDHDKSH